MESAAGKHEVRVRFAPSPTGYLHVGGARTAIFNWLFAKKAKGVFVLRIEDTDLTRSTPESEKALLEDLRWLGLDWGEGPEKGGPYAPYRQSERLELYREAAGGLVQRGHAYPCFCSEAELESKRREALKLGKQPQYDGTCRGLTPDEVAARRQARRPEVLRFKVPPGKITVADLIRGPVELPTSMVGDFVLLRSNGLPTYNFAAAVDDHGMGITCVLRGEEHLPNTLRQLLIYRAQGKASPDFGHLPLILGPDRSKLSKRHGACSIRELRREGFLASAVFNYLVLLGWSHSEEKEVLMLEELVEDFALERVGKSPAVFDREKLLWMSGVHIRNCSREALFSEADGFLPMHIREAYGEADRREILSILRDRVECFAELKERSQVFFKPPPMDEEAREVLKSSGSQAVLNALASAIEEAADTLTPEVFKSILKRVGDALSVRGKDLYFPVRAAVTGALHGPDLARVVALRGKAEVAELLRRAEELGAQSDV